MSEAVAHALEYRGSQTLAWELFLTIPIEGL